MSQPKGFIVEEKEDLVCKLKKSLYNLKQSPRMWYQKFDAYVLGLDVPWSNADHYVYTKYVDDQFLIVVIYVNDILFIENNKEMIKDVKY